MYYKAQVFTWVALSLHLFLSLQFCCEQKLHEKSVDFTHVYIMFYHDNCSITFHMYQT